MSQLLKLLSENSDYTPAELAMMLNEPEDYIKAQIRQYEQDGVIKGYRAIVNWDDADEQLVSAIIEVKVTPEKETGFDKIAEKISQFEEVKSVKLVAGSYDLSLVVTGETMNAVASFVSKHLSPIEQVISCQTNFILSNFKDGGVLLKNFDDMKDKREFVL